MNRDVSIGVPRGRLPGGSAELDNCTGNAVEWGSLGRATAGDPFE
jgi:hypothetical protein